MSFFSPVELVNTQTIALTDVERISINYVAESITFYEAEDEMLVLKEYLNDTDPELFARITVENDAITIKHGRRPKFVSPIRGYIEVFLPSSYYGALKVQTISGRIGAEGTLVLSDLWMNSTSGKLALGDITAGTADLSTVSGAIEARRLKAVAKVHSTSGAIRVGGGAGHGQYKNVSGAIEVAYQDVVGDITAGSVSGRVLLAVPSTLSFTVDAHSTSGRVDIPFTGSLSGGRHAQVGTIGQSPRAHIKLSTVSGRIEMIGI